MEKLNIYITEKIKLWMDRIDELAYAKDVGISSKPFTLMRMDIEEYNKQKNEYFDNLTDLAPNELQTRINNILGRVPEVRHQKVRFYLRAGIIDSLQRKYLIKNI